MQWLEWLKDMFHFRRRQATATLLLLAIVTTLLIINALPVKTGQREQNTADSLWEREYNDFQQYCIRIDSAKYRRYHRTYKPQQTGGKRNDDFFRNNIVTPVPAFNPNSVDSLTLIKIGFSPYVTRNILRYRAKGGVFRNAERFGKTYGLDSASFAAVKPHLVFASDTVQVHRHKSLKSDTIVELNDCDTTDLIKIRGIGSYRAQRIVQYRQKLGGYYSHEQLSEIGIPRDAIDSIRQHSTINSGKIVKININKASVGRLRVNPYLTFDKAKAIYDLRRNKIKIDNVEQIRELDIITDDDYNRLKHYLTAE